MTFWALFRSTGPEEKPLVRWVRIMGVAWLIVLLVESIAGPVFTSAPSYPFAFAAAGMVASLRDAAGGSGPRPLASALKKPTARMLAAIRSGR